jgi:pimeloyl-ACP methyl ester carboxylesterase
VRAPDRLDPHRRVVGGPEQDRRGDRRRRRGRHERQQGERRRLGAGWALLRAWLRDDGDVERYLDELDRPGALTGALNWYRAALHPRRELDPRRPFPSIAAPTLGVWSSGDNYLVEEGMLRSADHVTGPWRYVRIDGPSHWMQLDAPERVNELLLDFLA